MIELIIVVISLFSASPIADAIVPSSTNSRISAIDQVVIAPGFFYGSPITSATTDNSVALMTRAIADHSAIAPSANHSTNPPIAHIDLPTVTRTGSESKLDRYMRMAATRLDGRMQSALSHIPHDGRRLLAIKYYTRRASSIDGRWALSAKQIARHRAGKSHRTAVALVESIKARFAEQNPGYRLKVNTEVRSLEEQIQIWNSVGSTASAGDGILSAATLALSDSATWPATPTANDIARFTRLVASTGVSRTPTAAVPGLSLHGTGRAFDFIVCEGDKIVAGADAGSARSAWDKPEWTKKLKDAISAVSDRFEGPLRAPYEPWHYNYAP